MPHLKVVLSIEAMRELAGRIGRTRLISLGAALAAVLAAAGATFAVLGGDDGEGHAADTSESTATATASATSRPTATPEASATPIKHAGILDGVAMSDEEWESAKDRLPLAVMVDNTSGAYPHAGLDKADLVYEAFVEGGITRLMAVYWRQEAEKIMPVRSARTPFVIWASELGAMYGHAGGASTDNDANALGQIVEWAIRDLNAFSDIANRYYYRDSERTGPYDLATSTSFLRQAASQLGHTGAPAVESWKFREPGTPLPRGVDAFGIEIDFQGRLYSWQYIQWKWDERAARYLRFQFGGPHLDAITGQQLAFATVIVMEVPGRVVDADGHVVLEQLGSGDATVFTGGQAYAGTWKKETRESRTRFYTPTGEEIVFERGPIFIEVLGQQSRFAFVGSADDLPEIPEYVPPPPGSEPEEDSEPTATPEATALPTATPTPPSPTPTPSATSTPAPTPVPTSTEVVDPPPPPEQTPIATQGRMTNPFGRLF